MKNKLKYENTTFKTNNCGDCTIVEYKGANKIIVRFEDTGFTTTTALNALQRGEVMDRLKPSYFGVGIIGENHVTGDSMYNTWVCMLTRCYGAIQHKEGSSYKGCNMSEYFLYYPNFKEWCLNQVGFCAVDDKGKIFQLDKDILVEGNKVYGEDTCCFVPAEINGLQLTLKNNRVLLPKGVHYDKKNDKYIAQIGGRNSYSFLGRFTTPEEAFCAYKKAKENYVKEVANKWKDHIDPRVYETLMKYEVSIDD